MSMRFIVNVLEFFVTFGIVDNIIIYMFFRKFGNCPKNKWYQIGLLALIGSIMKILIVPVLYQIFLFVLLFLYNKKVNKFEKIYNAKLIVLMFIFLLITEVTYTMFFDIFKIIDLVEINDIFNQFLFLLPNKIIVIIFLKRCKKWDLFGSVKTQKKK